MSHISENCVINIYTGKTIPSNKKRSRMTVGLLYKKFNNIKNKEWDTSVRCFAKCLNTDIRELWNVQILNVSFGGYKKVYKLETDNNIILLSGESIIHTKDGEKEVHSLDSKDKIFCGSQFSSNPIFENIVSLSDPDDCMLMDTYTIEVKHPFFNVCINNIIVGSFRVKIK